jgi:hypothetical protein
LADDLERFLGRKPLLHAINPSRRERVRNWVARNYRWMAGAVLTISLGMVLGFYSAPLVKDHQSEPKPELETLAAWKQALQALDQKKPFEAVELLRTLAQKYPDHPLSNLYMGLALGASTADLLADDAQSYFRRAMSLPGAKTILKAWARNNPAIAQHLEHFASSRLEKVKQHDIHRNELIKLRGEMPESPQVQETKKRYYESMLEALRLALEVEPDSEAVIRQMAAVEGELGDFESANRRFTKLINALRTREGSKERDKLVDWITQRGRLVIHWSTDLRGEGDPTRSQRALKLLQGSAMDLGACEAIALEIASHYTDQNEYSDIAYYYFWIATETSIILGELERELGQDAQSRSTFRNAKKALDRLDGFARLKAIPLPARVEDLRKRCRDGLLSVPAKKEPTKS